MKLMPQLGYDLGSYIFLFFCTMAFIQIIWVLFIYLRVLLHKDKTPSNAYQPLSIIIAARNEEDNLFNNLPHILAQDYPEFEVIVVNHQSKDNSKFILRAFQKEFDNLRVIELEPNKHFNIGKKLPLTIGVKGAKYEHLLFTDADCKPASNQWLKNIAAQFGEKESMILGYGPYHKEKGLLNRIIRLDTSMIAMNYLGFAKARVPYMGVGRNLAYTKSLFESNKGFKSHYQIPSGDDDLFVQSAAKKKNYTICINKDAFAYSTAENSWQNWFRQKSRHFTTTAHYGVFKKLMLGIYPTTLLLLYTSFLILCLSFKLNWLVLIIFGSLIALKWIVQGAILSKLNERSFAWAFPLWDVFYAILAPVIYYTSEKSNARTWK
ncbi:glycosyltransferase [Lishizhenia sp.]|uniref:glycosyltransferase n=1 Tax=Lishizhenia sp. TaxID=2497594 RepID=UPI00299F34ED|nr:glycosyltransferase [Lishizhenia sp.]MDX1446066.1 glycosyltransferase [Lishizhenia sp.]